MSSKMLYTCLRVENLEKSIAFYQDALVLAKTSEKISRLQVHDCSAIWPCLEMTTGVGIDLQL